MKEDFEKAQWVILSIDSLEQEEVCEKYIKIFREKYLSEGHELAYSLIGMLKATMYLKFDK